jgi:hypothetical protein
VQEEGTSVSIADHTMEFMVGERTRLMEMSRDVTKYFVRVCAANAVGLSTFAYATTSQHVLTEALLRPVAIEGVPLSSTEVRREALRLACNMRHTTCAVHQVQLKWRMEAQCDLQGAQLEVGVRVWPHGQWQEPPKPVRWPPTAAAAGAAAPSLGSSQSGRLMNAALVGDLYPGAMYCFRVRLVTVEGVVGQFSDESAPTQVRRGGPPLVLTSTTPYAHPSALTSTH